MSRIILAVVMILFLVGTSARSVLAQDESDELPRLSMQPVGIEGSYFDLELEPGDEGELAVELGNFGTTEQAVRTYRANIYTRINGGLEAELDGTPTSGATDWLDYAAATFTLEAGETVVRTFTLAVPEDAEPGEYYTSLVIQNAEPVRGTGAIAVEQVLRQVVAVAIRVPGREDPNLKIGAASYHMSPALASVQVALNNTGNVRMVPTVELVLEDATGDEVTSATVDLDSIFPGTATVVEVGLVQPLEPGEYLVSVGLEDAGWAFTIDQVWRPLVVEASAAAETTAESAAITVESVTIEETRDDGGELQYVDAIVTIQNPSMQVSNAQLTLHVTRDGETVEDFVLGSSLSFPAGPAEFRQRYLPAGGWEPGTYGFRVTLETIDPNTGDSIELATRDTETTLVVE